ncbi:FAD-dependent oxidoreductase [Methylopila jiangsuensis]|uniref:FAD-dependent oxidoreductase n=1 Tax=Methylopila jiangsuensis TaxID=586230 RepID=A0A9W6JGW8_9HYPH|nr:FAD/NAD(P)-binding protein [Methylopila jiangsuensis]MDR6286051.1 putative NAD(P)/FAD-binding protein YdhS [Methylopila jiangsuensis]GLK75809.1 FAD-dependent oxidoreductase [Methylopila jiangsuensis]
MTLATSRPDRPTIVIVGGGVSGAVTAHQLARRAPDAFRIVVVEPRPRLGAGLAYSSVDAAHRINVPASRMSFVPSDPCHFDRWLKADGALKEDPEALTADGRAFPRRSVFGRYAAETIEPYVLSGEIEHVQATAVDVSEDGGRYRVGLSTGGELTADGLIFAATHPRPSTPAALRPLDGDARLIQDAQRDDALGAVAPDARVLIVGTGLTMADIVASLERRGHRGPILAVSRRGLTSRGHDGPAGDVGDFSDRPERRASRLLLRIRRAVRAARAQGIPWQRVLDAVRTQVPVIWAALPSSERRRVVRRLRPFWDVHRFRVAPQVEAAIARRQASGAFRILKAEPVRAEADEDGLVVTLRLSPTRFETVAVDAIVLATGPAHRSLLETNGFAERLAELGLITLDDVGLGLATDGQSRAIGADGRSDHPLWIAGPLARAAFGELMGLPEVTRHGEFVARELIRRFLDAAYDDERLTAA